MSTITLPPATGRDAARFMETYARGYGAGAFAAPTASEMDKLIRHGQWRWWKTGVGAVAKTLTRPSTRVDFTGRRYTLSEGSRVITHLATTAGARLPNLDAFDSVYTHIEDANVTGQLEDQGRAVRAVRVSAASELIACWGRAGSGYDYAAVDRATLTELPLTTSSSIRTAILAEVNTLYGWTDDFPYYSDGSWSALSLRGFNPADPTWGIKPAEMSKAWWAEHPDASKYAHCEWTVLAYDCPATVSLVESVCWWGELERVRLLRMAGREGKGGKLSRHTDITDRDAGTADGHIVRFHIPLITHHRVTMTAWNLRGERHEHHLSPWSMWYLDARKPHAVDNRSGTDRVHLVVDVKADAATRKAIASGRDHAA